MCQEEQDRRVLQNEEEGTLVFICFEDLFERQVEKEEVETNFQLPLYFPSSHSWAGPRQEPGAASRSPTGMAEDKLLGHLLLPQVH